MALITCSAGFSPVATHELGFGKYVCNVGRSYFVSVWLCFTFVAVSSFYNIKSLSSVFSR